MPESLLTILKFVFLAVLYLFFIRVLRAVWVETTAEVAPSPAPPSGRGGGDRPRPAAAVAPARAGKARPAATAGRLRVVAPAAQKGRTFDLGDELTIGRAPGCQVSLPEDTTVSQLHARVFRRDGTYWVEDLGSTNGTWVNRKQLTGAVALRRGDRVQVGETVLEVTR
ncbi:MAG TPA: FHA domain-containing protein [Acidimicrobiales bacterium]|nr:FHA domain-containing protein [Acidimicrobiales bacterium]